MAPAGNQMAGARRAPTRRLFFFSGCERCDERNETASKDSTSPLSILFRLFGGAAAAGVGGDIYKPAAQREVKEK